MSTHRIIPYDPRLKQLARSLRAHMTPAERRLWKQLRRKQIRGWSFYRQRPIDRYIVDFYGPDLGLVVEVDGRSHSGERPFRADRRRQERLEELGLRVIRFSDGDVMEDLENVVRGIEGVVADLEEGRTSP
jgi:very-short-patch-repair endonuclease